MIVYQLLGMLSVSPLVLGLGETCSNTVAGVYKSERRCTGQHAAETLRLGEGCAPRPTLMTLPWPNATHVDQMTPSHITVKQCDGSCTQYGHSCTPTRTRTRKIPVMFSKCGIDSGTCDKECSSLEVEEHEECSCSCSLLPRDCSPSQLFQADLCSCQCRDVLGRQVCLDSGRVWDESKCVCGCNLEQECADGQEFHASTCSCSAAAGQPSPAEEDRAARSSSQTFLSFEMIIILVLLSIILVLILIVFTLLMRIQTMKRNWRQERLKQVEVHQEEDQYSQTSKSDEGGFTEVPEAAGKRYTEVRSTEQLSEVNRSVETGDVDCSTPSSGFYSEVGQDRTEMDHLYQSAEQVRTKKHYKVPESVMENTMRQCTPVYERSLYTSPNPSMYSKHTPTVLYNSPNPSLYSGVGERVNFRAPNFPIEEAVRLLQQSSQ